jgi:hypothetical protein
VQITDTGGDPGKQIELDKEEGKKTKKIKKEGSVKFAPEDFLNFIFIYSIFLLVLGSKSYPRACYAGVLPLEPNPQGP